jgi:uncharacterized protein YutD
MKLYTENDFDWLVWDALCEARFRQRHKRINNWYRLLREFCGYTTGAFVLRTHLEKEIDRWIEDHPKWREQREKELRPTNPR